MAETHTSCVCFQHANTRSGRMFGHLCMLKANTGLVCLFAICTEEWECRLYFNTCCNQTRLQGN